MYSCSTQQSMKFQLLIKSKILKTNFLALNLSDGVFINVKMSTIVGILTFTSRTIFNMKKVKIVPSTGLQIYGGPGSLSHDFKI